MDKSLEGKGREELREFLLRLVGNKVMGKHKDQMCDSLKQRLPQLTSAASPSYSPESFRRIEKSFVILYSNSLHQFS